MTELSAESDGRAPVAVEPKASPYLYLSDDRPIYLAGTTGPSWRIRRGVVRLSRPSPDGNTPVFAGIARTGEILGSEVQLFGSYTCDAYPIGEVELEAWLQADTRSLLGTIAAAERRTAEAISLRAGEAMDRIRRLFVILSGETSQEASPVFIPRLKDMADITGLTQETVSRVVSQLRRRGILTRQDRSHGVIVLNALKTLPLQPSLCLKHR